MRRDATRPWIVSVLYAGVVALLSLLVAPASAEEGGDPPAEARPGHFAETIDVRVINLEVVVTDRDGNPVTGLGPQDFRLSVEGRPVPIEYFTEISGGQALEAAAGVDLPSAPAVSPGEDVGTSYLVFIDESFSIKRDRDRVLLALRDDLGFLGPQDRMAIVAYDGKRLEMLSSWSQSAVELGRALDRARGRKTLGLHRELERRLLSSDVELDLQADLLEGVESGVFDSGSVVNEFGEVVDRLSASFRQLSPAERNYVSRISVQVGDAVSAVAATMRAFARPPGRKVLLMLSGGWPLLPAQFATGETHLAWLYEGTASGESLYQPITDTANRLGYTIYPIDVPGLQATSGVSASDRTLGEASLRGRRGWNREWEVESTLHYIAAATGGRALVNAQREHALARAFEDTRAYYWIGFSPADRGDNERHRVRVETVRPGLRVRTRTDYLDLSRTGEATMAVESTLLFGHPPGGGNLRVEVGRSERQGRRLVAPLTVYIPLDQLTFLPHGEGVRMEAELRFAVQDADGDRAPIPVVPLEMTLRETPPAGAAAPYETRLELRRKAHDIVIAVHDPVTGRLFSTTARIVP